MIELAVRKRFPGFELDVAWSAGDDVVALFGASGAGKSVTLQCLAGLMRPDSGRIVVDAQPLYDSDSGVDLSPQSRRLGYVFQGYALFPHLTVEENLAFGLDRVPASDRRRRVAALMHRLGLDGLERRRPAQLSGGQQQRVALGRALAGEPRLLLLDEPLSALDAPLRRQLRHELRSVVRAFGKTTVLVTHDVGEAFQLADRVVVYDRGRVVQAAPKDELLSRPASEDVARLLGVRNILHGRVSGSTGELIELDWEGYRLHAARVGDRVPAVDHRTAFCIRPEYVRLVRKDRPLRQGPPMNLLSGRVVDALDMGTEVMLVMAINGSDGGAAIAELEVEAPKLVYEMLGVRHDRDWQLAIQPGAIQLLPGALG